MTQLQAKLDLDDVFPGGVSSDDEEDEKATKRDRDHREKERKKEKKKNEVGSL